MKKLFLLLLIFFSLINVGYSLTNINNCTSTFIANTPGETYELINDLTTATICIDVQANDVTIDCKGYNITGGNNNVHKGIQAINRQNVTVKNCNIIDTGNAIYFQNVDYGEITNINASSNVQPAILLGSGSNYNNVENIYVEKNSFYGISISASHYNNLSNYVSFDNSNSVIYIWSSQYNRLENISATGGTYYMQFSSSSYNYVYNTSGNDAGGFSISSSNYNTFNLSHIYNASDYGFLVQNSVGNKYHNILSEESDRNDFIYKTNVATCSDEFVNVRGTDNLPILYYNSAVTIDGWGRNFSSIILCNADNSVIKNINYVNPRKRNFIFSSYFSDNLLFDNIEVENYHTAFYMENTGSGGQFSNLVLNETSSDTWAAYHGNVHFLTGSNALFENITLDARNMNNNYGIVINGFSNSVFNNINSFSAKDGLLFYNSNNNIIKNSFFDSNQYGLTLSSSSNNYVDNIYATGSTYRGIQVWTSSTGNTINNSNSSNNKQTGIIFFSGSGNYVLNSYFKDNSMYDIDFRNSKDNEFSQNYLVSKDNIINGNWATYPNYFNSSISGYNLGNYWEDYTCYSNELRGSYYACLDSYLINTDTYDHASLSDSLVIINMRDVGCEVNNSVWKNCTGVDYDETISKIRVNCTSSQAAINQARFILTNNDDNNDLIDSTITSTTAGLWELDNSDLLVKDSGNFTLDIECRDSNSNINHKFNQWDINWGTLSLTSIDPTSDIFVNLSIPFNYSVDVSCSGGECGDIDLYLDPISGEGLYYKYEEINSSNNYNRYNCTTVCTPNNWDDGICEISDIGFDFPYFLGIIPQGTTAYLDTNGKLSFSDTGTGFPDFDWFSENKFIAMSWNDIIFNEGNTLYACVNQGTSGNKYAVFRHHDADWYDDTSYAVNVETILYEDGTIEMNYGNMTDYWGTYVGMSNGDWPSPTDQYTYEEINYESTLAYSSRIYSLPSIKGLVSTTPGAKPFYTTNANPYKNSHYSCLDNMGDGDSCQVLWNVVPTGESLLEWAFFAYTGSNYNSYVSSVMSDLYTITIIGDVSYVLPTPEDGSKISKNSILINVGFNGKNVTSCNFNYNGTSTLMNQTENNCIMNFQVSSNTIEDFTYNVTYVKDSQTHSLENRTFTYYPYISASEQTVPSIGLLGIIFALLITLLFS